VKVTLRFNQLQKFKRHVFGSKNVAQKLFVLWQTNSESRDCMDLVDVEKVSGSG